MFSQLMRDSGTPSDSLGYLLSFLDPRILPRALKRKRKKKGTDKKKVKEKFFPSNGWIKAKYCLKILISIATRFYYRLNQYPSNS